MGGQTHGYAKGGRAATEPGVTRRASARWARRTSIVLGVIEFDVEALVESRRKIFEWRFVATHVCVAYGAHGNRGSDKLGQVAARARVMTGKPRGRRVICPHMTGVASQRSMTLAVVLEGRIVEVGTLNS
jgi:hypothetical protein